MYRSAVTYPLSVICVITSVSLFSTLKCMNKSDSMKIGSFFLSFSFSNSLWRHSQDSLTKNKLFPFLNNSAFAHYLLRLRHRKKFTRSGVRTHAGMPPLELKSNALTTRPSWLSFIERIYRFVVTEFGRLGR